MRRLVLPAAVLLAVAGFVVAQASGGQGRQPPAPRPHSQVMPQALFYALGNYLHPQVKRRSSVMRATVAPPATTCDVAGGGGCSLHPCRFFVTPQASAVYVVPGPLVRPRATSCTRTSPAVPVAAGA